MPTGMPDDPYAPHPEQIAYGSCHDVLFVHCSTCKARPGVYCTRPGRDEFYGDWVAFRIVHKLVDYHPARREIVGLGYCDYCHARPGTYCVTLQGRRPTSPHQARRRWPGEAVGRPRIYAPYWPGLLFLDRAAE